VIVDQLVIQGAMVLRLLSSVATVRLTGHLDQLLHLNATMDQMVAVTSDLTDLSPMLNAIAVPHVLVSLPVSLRQGHGTQVVHRDQTATSLLSPSVRKPAVTSIGDARHFQLAGLTVTNVRGRNALLSLSVQEHPERQIGG
jgi:hypothetical protein